MKNTNENVDFLFGQAGIVVLLLRRTTVRAGVLDPLAVVMPAAGCA